MTNTDYYLGTVNPAFAFNGPAPATLVAAAVDTSCAAAADCVEVFAQGGTSSGNYLIDPDGLGAEPPFDVLCEQSADGGGWMVLQLANAGADYVFRTIPSSSNSDILRSGNQVQYYRHIANSDGFTDVEFYHDASNVSPNMRSIDISYRNPSNGVIYSPSQMAALGTQVTRLSSTTRQAAGSVDDYGMGGARGHESYISNGAGTAFINLTYGSQTADEQSGYYLYESTLGLSLTHNVTTQNPTVYGSATHPANPPIAVLPADYILPAKINLGWDNPNGSQWGGGAFWGYEDSIIRVGSGPVGPLTSPPDCQSVLALGGTARGSYIVDPDASGPVLPFPLLCEQSASPNMNTLNISYRHPLTHDVCTASQMSAIRAQITELSPSTRQTAGVVDDSGMSGDRGHEIYISDDLGTSFINVTYGTQQADGQSSYYLFHTSPGLTSTVKVFENVAVRWGDPAHPTNAAVPFLPAAYILPAQIRLGWDNSSSAQWGGGAFWGYVTNVTRVR